MQFKQGATIVTDEGKEVGHLDRVVIDPKSKDVTHIVIRKGLLISQDKVVPIQYIVTGKGDRITLQMDTDKLNELPDFEETHYVGLNEEELARSEKHSIFYARATGFTGSIIVAFIGAIVLIFILRALAGARI